MCPALVALALVGAQGCSKDDAEHDSAAADEQTAVWKIDPNTPPMPASERFIALVARLACNDGVTGEVLPPDVAIRRTEVVITFKVAPAKPGFHNCLGNHPVAQSVNVGQPIGDRQLVDGACLSGAAKSTSHCSEGAVRWRQTAS